MVEIFSHSIQEKAAWRVLDINSPAARSEAAGNVANGYGIAMSVHQYGAMYSADNPVMFWDKSLQLKDRKDPMAPTVSTEWIVQRLIDPQRVNREFFNDYVCNSYRFRTMMQGSCMLRFPVRPNATLNGIPLHSGIVSQTEDGPVMQVFYPGKTHLPVQQLVENMYSAGVRAPVITSLNFHGGKTPSTVEGVVEIANQAGLQNVILERRYPWTSKNESYPILVMDQNGVHLTRYGNLSEQDLHAIGWPIEASINNPMRYALFKALWMVNPKVCFDLLVGTKYFHIPAANSGQLKQL